jgi:DNA-binding response OmpR family regulator
MATLRQKIGDSARIQTIRGVGYRIVAGETSQAVPGG